jgi:hypothetical protein
MRETFEAGAQAFPSSVEEGWLREVRKCREAPYRADGVVLAKIS